MEGLSATGSIVSLVAITGQLFESTKALYEFWTSVKEVPSRLQWLSEDLKCLENSLESIRHQSARNISDNGSQNGYQALRSCRFHMHNLEALVAPFQSRTEDGKRPRMWKSIKAEFNAKKIELYRGNLEAAKASLLVTQIAITQLETYHYIHVADD